VRQVGYGGDELRAEVDRERERKIAVLAGHTGPVSAVAFSPDGGALASASEDGTVRLWDVRTLNDPSDRAETVRSR
jgi:WD40 repeat protein